MDSINRNQPEHNRKDLTSTDAVNRILATWEKTQTCFFCTAVTVGDSGGARPMNVRKVDTEGNLWFLIANDSHAYQEIQADPNVKLFFQGSPHSDFLHLNGRAADATSRGKIEELWEPIIKTWFTGGKDDPRIAVIRVTPTDGYYWDNKHGNVVAGVKMAIGAVIGKTLDDSIEGKVKI